MVPKAQKNETQSVHCQIFTLIFAFTLLVSGPIGCRSPRSEYQGPGTFSTKRALADGVYLDKRYAIILTNFPLSEPLVCSLPIEHLPVLGGSCTATIGLAFLSTNTWTKDQSVIATAKRLGLGLNIRNTSEFSGNLKIKVVENHTIPVCDADAALSNYTWSGHHTEAGFCNVLYGFRGTMFQPKRNASYDIYLDYNPTHGIHGNGELQLLIQK
jgi:hypothetical protein